MALIKKAKIVLLLAGLCLFGYIVYRIGFDRIASELGKVGGYAVFLLIPYGVVHILDALGWRVTLGPAAGGIRFGDIFLSRLAGEAINYITPSAYLGGEPIKAYLLKKHDVPLVNGLASVVTAKTMIIIAQLLFVLLGISLAAIHYPDSRGIVYGALLVAGFLTVNMVVLVFAQKRGLFTGLLRLLEALRLPAGFLRRRADQLRELDEVILLFYDKNRAGFFSSAAFFISGWMVGSLEIYFLFHFLGEPVDLATAVSLEALTTVIRAAVFFIPSGVGALEGGVVLLFGAFGYLPVTAITYAIVRRVREAFWIGLGLLYLVKHEMSVVQ